MKKSQSRNSRLLKSLPPLPSSLHQPWKAQSSTPPLLYSPSSSPPFYASILHSTSPSPLSSPPIMRQNFTLTSSVHRPILRRPTTTPTSTPSLSRTGKMFGLRRRSLSPKTSYISSLTTTTLITTSPTSSPHSGVRFFT